MKTPKYLSPTSINKFYSDRQEFYLKYLADVSPPRIPQTQPMSIGASFDAYIKSYLVDRIYGKGIMPQFDFTTIFESQVENHNRDWAIVHGKHVFDKYVESGACADLMLELSLASSNPRFEFTVEGRVGLTGKGAEIGEDGIPLLGKPDVYFRTKDGARVVYDWKVNGYCGKSPTSPKKGYIKVRDCFKPPTKSHGQSHKDCQSMNIGGITVNVAQYFEDVDKDIAIQLAIYSWLLGEEVGAQPIIGIDQIVAKGADSGRDGFPLLRVATHRSRISKDFQIELYSKIKYIWTAIKKKHIFDDLSYADNLEKMKVLDDYHKAFASGESLTDSERWFLDVMRA